MMFPSLPINRTTSKLASWRCYRNGHQYSFSQLQEASATLWKNGDGVIKCKRCGKETDIEECDDPALAVTRVNRTLFTK